jgi:hypothetical protein
VGFRRYWFLCVFILNYACLHSINLSALCNRLLDSLVQLKAWNYDTLESYCGKLCGSYSVNPYLSFQVVGLDYFSSMKEFSACTEWYALAFLQLMFYFVDFYLDDSNGDNCSISESAICQRHRGVSLHSSRYSLWWYDCSYDWPLTIGKIGQYYSRYSLWFFNQFRRFIHMIV